MSPAPDQPYWVERPAQLRALASPVRQEIVDALESAGALTMAELGGLLGRRPDGLYFHVRRLLKAGLVIERDRRRDGRHASAVYDLPGRPVRLTYRAPATARGISAVVAAALRTGSREFAAALARHFRSGGGDPPGELWGARAKGWLSDEEATRVRALLGEALRIVRSAAPRPGARAVSLSLALAPVEVAAGPEMQGDQP